MSDKAIAGSIQPTIMSKPEFIAAMRASCPASADPDAWRASVAEAMEAHLSWMAEQPDMRPPVEFNLDFDGKFLRRSFRDWKEGTPDPGNFWGSFYPQALQESRLVEQAQELAEALHIAPDETLEMDVLLEHVADNKAQAARLTALLELQADSSTWDKIGELLDNVGEDLWRVVGEHRLRDAEGAVIELSSDGCNPAPSSKPLAELLNLLAAHVRARRAM